MELIVHERPNMLKDAALLCELAFKSNLEEDIKLIKTPEKYGLTDEIVKEKYGVYTKFLNHVVESMSDQIVQAEMLRPYMDIITLSDLGELSIITSAIVSYVINIEELSFEKFLESSCRELYSEHENNLEDKFKNLKYESLDYSKLYEMIDNQNFSSEIKYYCISYFYKLKDIYEVYYKLLDFAIQLLEDNYYMIEGIVNEKIAEFKVNNADATILKELDIPFISDQIEIESMGEYKLQEIDYYISIIGYNRLTFMMPEDKLPDGLLMEGIYVRDLIALREGHTDLASVKPKLLALGDNTRFEILTLLAERPYYLKELADALKLTSATVSHHVMQLLNNEIVKVELEGRKVFYHLNRRTLSNIGDVFKTLGVDDND